MLYNSIKDARVLCRRELSVNVAKGICCFSIIIKIKEKMYVRDWKNCAGLLSAEPG